MARNEPQVNLRMPEDLKAALDEEAARNRRSLTAEIVERLRLSFEPVSEDLEGAVKNLESRLVTLESTVKAAVKKLKE